MSRPFLLSVLAVALVLGLAATWLGNRAWHHYEKGKPDEVMLEERRQLDENGLIPLQELIRRLSLPEASRILEIELERHKGNLLYEIELLTPEGTVKEFLVDPRTGRVVDGREKEEEEE